MSDFCLYTVYDIDIGFDFDEMLFIDKIKLGSFKILKAKKTIRYVCFGVFVRRWCFYCLILTPFYLLPSKKIKCVCYVDIVWYGMSSITRHVLCFEKKCRLAKVPINHLKELFIIR